MMDTETKTDWPAELERLARDAEPAALAKADEVFSEVAAEHERQTAGYRFECRRWGDFLSIFIERQANEKGWWGEAERKLASSINIGRTTQIELVEGHCFDRRGTLTYGYSMPADDKSGNAVIGGTGFGKHGPSKGYHYEVRPQYPHIPTARRLIVVEAPQQDRNSGHFIGDSSYSIRHETEGYPRLAKDDEIRFIGIATTLYAPAGKGRSVYDAILAEIANGYEPPAIADTLPKGEDREDGLRAEQG